MPKTPSTTRSIHHTHQQMRESQATTRRKHNTRRSMHIQHGGRQAATEYQQFSPPLKMVRHATGKAHACGRKGTVYLLHACALLSLVMALKKLSHTQERLLVMVVVVCGKKGVKHRRLGWAGYHCPFTPRHCRHAPTRGIQMRKRITQP